MRNRFAVIDIETTGFGKKDGIIEIGIVLLDGDEIVLEWETLVNPNRDISNTQIHGISPKHLSTAPFFSEISNDVAALISDRVLVAHNLAFDQRMLLNEFHKLEVDANPGQGICTYSATKLKLEAACEKFGIRNAEAHRALTDARSTAMLLSRAKVEPGEVSVAQISFKSGKPFSRTISRTAFEPVDSRKTSRIRRIMHTLEVPNGTSAQMSYMDALTSALSDLHLDLVEKSSLIEWAESLGLSSSDVKNIHKEYLVNFVEAAKRDGIVTQEESQQIDSLADLLEVSNPLEHQEMIANPVSVQVGMRVCFTGTAMGPDGKEIPRETLEARAIKFGLIPVASVTKKACDLVVAADVNSMSSKAKRAKEWGIPVLGVLDFLKQV